MAKKRRRTTEELTIAMQRQITELALRLAAVHLVLDRKGILKVRDYVAARKEIEAGVAVDRAVDPKAVERASRWLFGRRRRP
jgi:hypothetical protein